MTGPSEVPRVAVALLLVDGRYALQLRDDRPDIGWPGHWTLFGGVVEAGETFEQGVVRELSEELALAVPAPRLFAINEQHRDSKGRRTVLYVFEADVTASWPRHCLGEGQRAEVFAPNALPHPMVPYARAMVLRHAAVGDNARRRDAQ